MAKRPAPSALRTAAAARERAAAASPEIEPGRWAVTRIFAAGEDPFGAREEVLTISRRDPPSSPPPLPGLDEGGDANRSKYRAEQVPSGVMVGMIRGGPVNAVGGFGFPDPTGKIGSRDRGLGGTGRMDESATRHGPGLR
jgi:hypothetical protein